MFPLTKLWEGPSCGRGDECVTCYQGAENIPNCTEQSVLYENICVDCIPAAGSKEDIGEEDIHPTKPAIYVGESSRGIMERSREHWSSYRGRREDSLIWKHQQMEHCAAPANFQMRVAGHFRTALARQVGEAVRIRRRGEQGIS